MKEKNHFGQRNAVKVVSTQITNTDSCLPYNTITVTNSHYQLTFYNCREQACVDAGLVHRPVAKKKQNTKCPTAQTHEQKGSVSLR